MSWLGTHFRHWRAGGRDGRARRRRRRAGAGVALEHVLAQSRHHPRAGGGDRAHVPEAPRRRCRPARPGEWYAHLPAVREGLRRPLGAVAVRERRRLADLRRRARARQLRARLRVLRAPTCSRRVLDAREVERRPDLVRVHRRLPADAGAALHASRPRRSSRTWTSAGRARPACRAGWPRCPTITSATCRRARRRSRACRSWWPTPRRTAGGVRSRSRAGPAFVEEVVDPGRRERRLRLPAAQRRQRGQPAVAGAITFRYEDGTDATQYVVQDRNVSGWWYPSLKAAWPEGYGQPRNAPLVKLAWRGRSDVCPNVGIYWYGLDNPHPERSDPLDRPLEHARRRDLRGRRTDAGRPAAPPEAAARVVRRSGQLGRGGDRLRARRGARGRRRPRRRVPHARPSRRAGRRQGRTRRASSCTTRRRTATWPTTTATTRRSARSSLTVTGSGEKPPCATCCCRPASAPPRRGATARRAGRVHDGARRVVGLRRLRARAPSRGRYADTSALPRPASPRNPSGPAACHTGLREPAHARGDRRRLPELRRAVRARRGHDGRRRAELLRGLPGVLPAGRGVRALPARARSSRSA